MPFRCLVPPVVVLVGAAIALIAPGASARGTPVALVNCGSNESYTDTSGLVWESDKLHSYYSFGGTNGTSQVTVAEILQTEDDFLYETSRVYRSRKPAPFLYEIPVPSPAKYTVVLHFCEIAESRASVGRRVFDIALEGSRVVEEYDIFQAAGAGMTAVTVELQVIVLDGALSFTLHPVRFNPQISAIGVFVFDPADVDFEEPIALINAGGPAYTDSTGRQWEKDNLNKYYQFGGTSGGSVLSLNDINGTDDPALFQSNRVFKRFKPSPYLYQIPVPDDGEYSVSLLFCEIDSKRDSPGDRRFDVWIEGVLEFSMLDVVERAGGAFKALELNRVVAVQDGFLSIEFNVVKQNPIVSGISVYRSAVLQSPTPSSRSTSAPSIVSPPSVQPNVTPNPTTHSLSSAPYRTSTPTLLDSNSPSVATLQSDAPSSEPMVTNMPSALPFQPILMNCGGDSYVDTEGNVWLGDSDAGYSIGGATAAISLPIAETLDDQLYQSHRYGSNFFYEIAVPPGDYEVALHFSEIQNTHVRMFDILLEGVETFPDVNVAALVGVHHAVTMEVVVEVTDGFLTVHFQNGDADDSSVALVDAFVSAIEVKLFAPHLAHAVARGPYAAVDIYSTGFAEVHVDGSFSHTHGPGLTIESWFWTKDGDIVDAGELAVLTLPVGEHSIILRVKDTDNNKAVETFTVNIFPAGFAVLSSITPDSGSIEGDYEVQLSGSGFGYTEDEIVVNIGSHELTGLADIAVVDQNTILVRSWPSTALGLAVSVTVSTPISTSNNSLFTYVNGVSINFKTGLLDSVYSPSCLAFGPDLNLYVGTGDGLVVKLFLNDSLDAVTSMIVSSAVADSGPDRIILGIAFDPMDTSSTPGVYVSHSMIFHGESKSSSGAAINGKVSVINGANLDVMTDIVTGLPVSDHDHAVSGLEFGDHGELYIVLGGNTNGGIPGALSNSLVMKENVLGAAVLVARLSKPDFDGTITYDALDNGNQVGGVGSVDVFASGTRNAYDLVLHSNGNLYSTDNGPNLGYGDMSTSCSTGIPDIEEEDKLLRIVEGGYYGHANRKRGETDPRQCIWHSSLAPGDEDYTAPMAIFEASTNGIIEWESLHFQGQLRGNLIASQYKGSLFRMVLSADGESVVPESLTPIILSEQGGLDVTQSPDGTLFVVKYKGGRIRFLRPDEPPALFLEIKSVFPRRGSMAGGNDLRIYGENFVADEQIQVYVGGSICPVTSRANEQLTCTLPGGSGPNDIEVVLGEQSFTYSNAYRYISGVPVD